jgi:hypothetical protein
MSDKNHLLILAAAAPRLEGGPPAPRLPALARLLARMEEEHAVQLPPESPSMPWEVALARLCGLPAEPGLIPWAAFESGIRGTPCAWVRPCFWQVGVDHVLPADPDALELDETSSRAFLAAMAPYFSEDGIGLAWHSPSAWLATGETFRHLTAISLDRVIGRRITPAVFGGATPEGAKLRRLQNEMQMLLYTHPANDTRQAAGLVPLNSFWVTGAGVLDAPAALPPGVHVERRLRGPSRANDPEAHARAWHKIDADAIAPLLARAEAGETVRITLCGEERARTWRTARPSLGRRLAGLFGRARGEGLLETL